MAISTGRRITKRMVDDARPGAAVTFIRDADIKGFGLKVSPGGAKTYFVEYRLPGGRIARKGRYTIGRHGAWTVDLARDKAREVLGQVARGIDPQGAKVERERVAVELAFSAFADRFVETYAKQHQTRSWAQAKRTLDHDVKPVFKSRPLPEITKREIGRLLDDIADRAPAVARYAHATLRKLFRWAVDRGHLDRSPMEGMTAPKAGAARSQVLTDQELTAVWGCAGGLGAPFGPIYRLLIATGQRREEVGGMAWEEVDLASATWTIPGARAKNKHDHIVPLNAMALATLKALGSDTVNRTGLIFSRTGTSAPSGWSKAKRRLDAVIVDEVAMPDWRIHDLRRTMATGLQRLGVRLEVTEAVLNHVSGSRSGIVGVYQRHDWADEKRVALEVWGNHLERLIAGGEAGRSNVVPIARKAAG